VLVLVLATVVFGGPIAAAVLGHELIPTNILLEAGISFLGFGVPLPESSWGNMLATSWGSVRTPNADPFAISPWVTFFPSFAIFVTVLAFNLFGEGLRAAADPGSAR
jgi:peptide/nickel transport system permease protein